MYKLYVLLKKETLLFLNDKVGLALMFLLPILLVFIITIIQNNAFKMLEGKQIKMLVVNHDKGQLGKKLVNGIDQTGMFEVQNDSRLSLYNMQEKISAKEALTGLYISEDFSQKLQTKTEHVSVSILSSLGMNSNSGSNVQKDSMPVISFVHDPTMQESYCFSILNVIQGQAKGLEMEEMINGIYTQMGVTNIPKDFARNLKENNIVIKRVAALKTSSTEIPNSSQHNVPAWTVFAMFFMVVSLGTNIVVERNSGSFVRIKTMPTEFSLIIFSKQMVYFMIAVLQVLVIFSIGFFIFPHIGLPKLFFPDNVLGMITITAMCCLAAVSYAVMIGAIMKTPEQANGFGAISIIIFATFGGVWVPLFVLPEFMQKLSVLSPLHWCIEGYYVLFLKNGNWLELSKVIIYILSFSIVCQTIAYLKLRKS